MNTASTASQNVRDTVKDAREAMQDIRNAAAQSSDDFQKDLHALRDDFNRLADQVAGIVGGTGNAAWRRAKSSVDEAIADAQDKGHDAASAVREVSDHFVESNRRIDQDPALYDAGARCRRSVPCSGRRWRR